MPTGVVIVDVNAWMYLLVCLFCKCYSGAVIGVELCGILAEISPFFVADEALPGHH